MTEKNFLPKQAPGERMQVFLPAAGQDAPQPDGALSGQAGSLCPRCQQGVLDYDGMLNLICPVCKYVEGGCFT